MTTVSMASRAPIIFAAALSLAAFAVPAHAQNWANSQADWQHAYADHSWSWGGYYSNYVPSYGAFNYGTGYVYYRPYYRPAYVYPSYGYNPYGYEPYGPGQAYMDEDEDE